MGIVDQAFAAFERSAEDGVKKTATQTVERADERGKLELTGRSVTRHVRRDAGDVRYLEVAMEALAASKSARRQKQRLQKKRARLQRENLTDAAKTRDFAGRYRKTTKRLAKGQCGSARHFGTFVERSE